jgi:deoxyribonuclease V
MEENKFSQDMQNSFSEESKESSKIERLIKKYKIDIPKLEKEQLKLSKELQIKNKIDFSLADRFGAVDNTFINNKLLCCFIVCNGDFEVIDRAYVFEKVNFPYIPGFRNYRELLPMVNAYDKLTEKPDVVFVSAQGIIHPRLGLASHFGLSTGVPTIGVSDSIIGCQIEGDEIFCEGKKVGKVLLSKPGSNPMYISPGNYISIESAYDLSKKLISLPHKKPEPLHLAGKYSKEVRKELFSSDNT